MTRAKLQRTRARLRGSDEFALAAHQLTAVKDPCAPIRALVASRTERVASAAYSLWRDDPELARALDDRRLPRRD